MNSNIPQKCKEFLFRHGKSRRVHHNRSNNNSNACINISAVSYLIRRGLRSFSSVSATEVLKFSELNKSWWDPRRNPLIGMNSIRVEYIINELQQISSTRSTCSTTSKLSGIKGLDVGCGGGLLSESLARLGVNVTAVDPSHALAQHAKKHAEMDPKTRSIDYKGGYSIEELAQEFRGPFYDIICILEVLEHVTDVESVLASARLLLKPDKGRLFVSTLNRTAKSKLMAIIGAEYIMGYLPPGTHDWNQFRSPQEVEGLMNRAGFEQVDVQGLVITKPPLLGQWDWKLDPTDTDINWIGTYKLSHTV